VTVPVPFDPELVPALEALPYEPPLAPDTIDHVRQTLRDTNPTLEAVITSLGVDIDAEEHLAPGPEGAPDVALTVLRPRGRGSGAAVFNIHGGGMVMDDRHADHERLVPLVDALGVTAVTVEYRLAPEHPHPAPVEDCYAGLVWTIEHAAELGFDPARLVVMGGSAGGGLAAGVSLLARDRGGPRIAGQMLLCPMLDDRERTASAHQYEAVGTWQGPNNRFGWESLLQDAVGGPDVLAYAAPARAVDLTRLPPAFVEVGAAELFRDEDVEYASRIWAVGGQAELHVWAGGYHGFERIAPDAAVSRAALDARESWLRRILSL